ncbi:hypothetical protein, conserved [Eimeria tenella]|uniref:VTT domain-containing protein n=1 Tax=Eimeria tenella TaxID=5802 RepID=U6L2L0_EIMTE|nr:hypothetical protein, conserved [Eimeria tenella]CDJ42000.1 hypothetical protein, conserved [Eimeria tenella]|eukprot:XP_013232750.1 hypothetical protein, conserved [Eimeria tenella]
MAIFLRLFSQRHSSRRSSLEDVAAVSPRERELLTVTNLSQSFPASSGPNSSDDPDELPPTCGRVQLGLLGVAVSACFIILFLLPFKDVLRQVVEHQKGSPLTYALTYVVAGLVVPAPLLSVLAGVLMGPSLLAVFVIMCGSMGAACLAFFISRFMLRRFVVNRFVRRSKQLQAIDLALQKDSVKLVLCTRMILPFTFNNYFLGTTPISAATFAVSTLVTGIPFAVLYAIIGGQLQSLDNALAAKSFELQGADVDVFGFFTMSKRHLEVIGICGGILLCFFVVRTIKRFAAQVVLEAQEVARG